VTLSFLIPHDWEETLKEDHYLYSLVGADSGWFRVSLNTFSAVDETPTQMLKRLFDGRENVTHDEQTGNCVCTYERNSGEEGAAIHLYYWIAARVVEPDLVREAVFSFTVLSERTNDQRTTQMLNLIGQIVNGANFSPKISDASDHK